MPEPARYRAFISYSHADKAVADWLHRALESYRVPPKLVGRETAKGPVPARLTPIFRDRDELPAADDLGSAISAALSDSSHLVVICSPRAARSKWVDQEIATFKRLHGEARILAVIAAGEPYASGTPDTAGQECFPPSLRVRFDAAGQPTAVAAEPIAADIRAGKDGRRLALLKLVAGLTGLGLDDLAQRDAQRRIRRLTMIAVAAVLGMVAAVGLALYANGQRVEADRQRAVAQAQRAIAERESAAATSAADFLIGTFALSNPATENPRTISALTILDRGASRARTELAGQPALQARLAATLGGAYAALGLLPEAEQAVLASRQAIERAGPDGAAALLRLADIYRQRGDTKQALVLVADARRMLNASTGDRARLLGLAGVIEGRVHASQMKVKPGIAAFDDAVTAFQKARDAQPGDLVLPLHEKGMLLSDDGQFAAADATLLRALQTARRTRGEQHRQTAAIWLSFALNAFQQGQYALAAERLAPAQPILRRVLDPANPMLADAILMQGRIELGQERYGAAARSLRQAIGVYRAAFRKPHPTTGATEVYLGLAEGGRGDLPDALAAFDRAKVEYDGSYGAEHPNHGDLMVNRATVLAKFGRTAAARADCAGGMTILTRTLGAGASYTKTMAETCVDIG